MSRTPTLEQIYASLKRELISLGFTPWYVASYYGYPTEVTVSRMKREVAELKEALEKEKFMDTIEFPEAYMKVSREGEGEVELFTKQQVQELLIQHLFKKD